MSLPKKNIAIVFTCLSWKVIRLVYTVNKLAAIIDLLNQAKV